MTVPLVSVLMTVYNSERYIARAIGSVLAQTLGDIELIVMDDGSTDSTPQVLAECQRADARVVVKTCPHRGIVPSLNQGLEICRGRYIARLDADDFCLPRRLEIQTGFMEKHPKLVLLGSSVLLVDENGHFQRLSIPPLNDSEIRVALLLDNPFSHSAVMLRASTLKKNMLAYDPQYDHAEDYDLWSRMLEFGEGGNLLEPSAARRIHAQQRSTLEQDDCSAYAEKIACRNIARTGNLLAQEDVRKLRRWDRSRPVLETQEDLLLAIRWIEVCGSLSQQAWADGNIFPNCRVRWLLRFLFARMPNAAGFRSRLEVLRQFKAQDLVFSAGYLRKRADYLRTRRKIANIYRNFDAISLTGRLMDGSQPESLK